MSPLSTARWQLHFCVLLWGFTAILGKLITLEALALVWWRLLLVVASLLLFPRVWRGLRGLPPRLLAAYAGIGVLVALHWITFYGAIKLSNASVAVSCLAVAPACMAVVEPWVSGRRFDLRELLLGVAVVPGVMLVVGGIPAGMHLGVAVGLASALLSACFGALNKRYVERADPLVVTLVELGAGLLFMSLLGALLPLLDAGAAPVFGRPSLRDAVLLLVLALGCTLLPFTLSLVALRRLSAFGAQLAVNLEPVYAIGFAMLLLGEQHELGLAFYAGVAVILSAVFIHPLVARSSDVLQPADALPAGFTDLERPAAPERR